MNSSANRLQRAHGNHPMCTRRAPSRRRRQCRRIASDQSACDAHGTRARVELGILGSDQAQVKKIQVDFWDRITDAQLGWRQPEVGELGAARAALILDHMEAVTVVPGAPILTQQSRKHANQHAASGSVI